MRNLLIFALLYLSGCSVFLSAPEPVDVGFPGRSDTGLLDVGSRDVRPDTMPLDMGVVADAGVQSPDASDGGHRDADVVADSGLRSDVTMVVDVAPGVDIIPSRDAADIVDADRPHDTGATTDGAIIDVALIQDVFDGSIADAELSADAGAAFDGSITDAERSRDAQLDGGGDVDSGPDGGYIEPGRARSIALGGLHTCAVIDDGTVQCFGDNQYGQLGLDDLLDRNGAREVPGVTGVSSLALGSGTSCAVHDDQSVSCWGRNDFGQTGDGNTQHHAQPRTIAGLTRVAQMAVGMGHACARTQEGTVLCWGRNAEGQIGDGTTTRRPAPTQVQGLSGVLYIAAGFQHTCVLRNDQSVFCWGANGHGQLGFAGVDSTRPRRVNAPAPVTTLSTVWDHSCATMSGVAACWGWNEFGQLGTNTREASRPPSVVMGLVGVDHVAAGGHHSCALRDGDVLCWGQNQGGQLGTGNRADSNRAIEVPNLLGRMVAVDTGYYHTCSLSSRGVVWCWGYNEHGQVGDGTWLDRSVPFRVWGL